MVLVTDLTEWNQAMTDTEAYIELNAVLDIASLPEHPCMVTVQAGAKLLLNGGLYAEGVGEEAYICLNGFDSGF